jgi:hypothetical protein
MCLIYIIVSCTHTSRDTFLRLFFLSSLAFHFKGLAPGVSHREAGGLSVRQAIDAIHCIPGKSRLFIATC